ncbi:hypothetical protein ACLFMI_15500 [Pseudonocardia nantongensis]|uniref:Rv2732c family membrane protein n=1 Tax=Pseudonocardia nantongensis TaxID=1181885 RepID=UPI00397CD6DB
MSDGTSRSPVEPTADRPMRRRIDPGPRAMLFAVLVMVAVGAILLPWVAGAPGWQVLTGAAAVGPLPTLFSWTLTAFVVVASASALLTRLWVLTWLAAIGSGIASVNGLWAIWSQQTGGPAGPGFGMVLGALAAIVLTFNWAGMALRRG